MPEEEKKTGGEIPVDIDTSGPEVDVSVEEVVEEGVIENAPETTEQETVTEVKAETEKEDEQLEDYSKKVQSRIAKLTGKLREAQRRENAAIEYASAVEKKRKMDQERFKQVDSDYTKKFEENVKTGIESAERELSIAIEAGDASAQVLANKKIASLAFENAKLEQRKSSAPVEQEKPVQLSEEIGRAHV
jgi:hypothetical protein